VKENNACMKMAIAGTGMTGAYLFRLLKNSGVEADLYDQRLKGGCGLTPCAWGTSPDFFALVEAAGLAGEKYIFRRLDYLDMDDVRVKADIMTFDKPKLIADLVGDAQIRFGPLPVEKYDRVIDATGVCRALLPSIEEDVVMECRQYLVETTETIDNRIRLGGIGYAWCFPLSENLYHTGCGSLLDDPQRILDKLGWLENTSARHEKIVRCQCSGKIRLTGPHRSLPFVADGCKEGIWGVGESIGCVAPLAGDGIVPGMRSVQLLLESWDNPAKYRDALFDEFHWMRNERRVVDRLRNARRVGLLDALVLRRNSRRMGMDVRLKDAMVLLKSLR
jgi:2-polyprenyl-6-methoxyphenol hydroxylase-like FAD-dependent oxidoreductase